MMTRRHLLAACLSVQSLASPPGLRADIIQSGRGKQRPQQRRSVCNKQLFRLCLYLLWLGLAFFFGQTTAAASAFTAQQALAESYPDLQYWFYTIARIEITKGSVVGSNGSPPTVEFKIVEVLRKGRFSPRKSQIVVASWLEDRAGGDQWSEHNMAGTLDQWSSIETESPPPGTKLIAFLTVEPSPSVPKFLSKDSVFADTPENKTTALSGMRHQSFLQWSSELAFWLIFICTLASFIFLFVSPKWAPILSLLAWLSYIFYNSQVSVLPIRLDMLMIYPALGIASLIAAAGFALWVRAEGRKG